jgi:hypothetical protein
MKKLLTNAYANEKSICFDVAKVCRKNRVEKLFQQTAQNIK